MMRGTGCSRRRRALRSCLPREIAHGEIKRGLGVIECVCFSCVCHVLRESIRRSCFLMIHIAVHRTKEEKEM